MRPGGRAMVAARSLIAAVGTVSAVAHIDDGATRCNQIANYHNGCCPRSSDTAREGLDYRNGSQAAAPQRREGVALALERRAAHRCTCRTQAPSESFARRPAAERLRTARVPFGTHTDEAR